MTLVLLVPAMCFSRSMGYSYIPNWYSWFVMKCIDLVSFQANKLTSESNLLLNDGWLRKAGSSMEQFQGKYDNFILAIASTWALRVYYSTPRVGLSWEAVLKINISWNCTYLVSPACTPGQVLGMINNRNGRFMPHTPGQGGPVGPKMVQIDGEGRLDSLFQLLQANPAGA